MRDLRRRPADPNEVALIALWKDAHIDEAVAENLNKLAKSPIAIVFEQEELDVMTSPLGDIVALERRGEVDYKKLAITHLGAKLVESLAEAYRKPPTKTPHAPTAWRLEAGLPK